MPAKPSDEQRRKNALTVAKILREQVLAEQYGKSLKAFLKAAWPTMQPGVPFVDGWHLDCVCEHVEALFRRDIRRLIINISPRSLKSSIISIAAPAWRWINYPDEKFLCASFSKNLSLHFSRKTRDLIKSPWYQARWSDKFALTADQNEKGEFENDKGGYRFSSSVEAGVLGRGGSFCLDGDSRITTDKGMIPIRDIVERRLPVTILASNGTYQNIQHYSRTPGRPLLEFTINTGDIFQCTDGHPIWVDDYGYIRADEVVSLINDPQNRDIHLRGLRQDLREKQVPCGQSKAPVLFQQMFYKISNRGKQLLMEGWSCKPFLQSVREGLHGKTGSREKWPRVLFSLLFSQGKMGWAKAGAEELPVLSDSVSATNNHDDVLFDDLRELAPSGEYSRRKERSVRHRNMARSIWPRLPGEPEASHQKAGRAAVCDLPEEAESASRSPYRRFQNESRSRQSSDVVRQLSSDWTYAERYTERVDETVWVTHVRRCETPVYVYNLEVAPCHDYYVENILTHNSVYDDPNDLDKMQFPDYRQSVRDWYSGTASSRYIDPKTDVRLCVQQRASYGDDLTAYLLELGGWEHLVIPNEFDGRRIVSSIGWQDPRTKQGELMQPARFGPEETAILKREQRENYAGQFQQSPISNDGTSIKREWFRFYNPPGIQHNDEHGKPIPVRIATLDGTTVEIVPTELPVAFEHCLDSWDMAFKSAEHNDYVAGHQLGRLGANCYLLNREHGHWNFPDTLAAVRRLATHGSQEKLVEDAANGRAVIDTLTNEIPGIIAVTPEGGKWARTAAISGYIESGNVYLPNPDLFPWVWDIMKEFSDGLAAKHDDDRDAMTQGLKRLYDSMSRTGVPEFRIQPRLGEPQTACHVAKFMSPVGWRRFVAIVPNQAALWMAETPSGCLQVLRELSLDGVDAVKAGREIGRISLPDVIARSREIRSAKQSYELLLPKEAFAELEPVGCYAEMLEQALLGYEVEDGDYDARQHAKACLREAHFRSDMVEEQDAALDRLRALLAFQPPDFQKVSYDRTKALRLSETDIGQYTAYMAAVDGEVHGEWPKLKISPECVRLVAQLGSFRRDKIDEAPPMVRALLLAVCAPLNHKPKEIVAKPYSPPVDPRSRFGRRSFARR